MTNAEFIKRLRKAKEIALRLYPNSFCILDACEIAFKLRAGWHNGCDFVWPARPFGGSQSWVIEHCKSPADIALVFDNSIADRQREIAEGKP